MLEGAPQLPSLKVNVDRLASRESEAEKVRLELKADFEAAEREQAAEFEAINAYREKQSAIQAWKADYKQVEVENQEITEHNTRVEAKWKRLIIRGTGNLFVAAAIYVVINTFMTGW